MAYEDFTTFTEVDIGADRIQKTANHIDHLAFRNETTYLYKDYGINHFGDFTHKIKVRGIAVDNSAEGVVWTLADALGDIVTLNAGSDNFIALSLYDNDTDLKFWLYESHSGTLYSDTYAGANFNTWYYVKIVKSGTSLNAYIYSDSDYSVLVDTLSLTLHADHSFRYLYGCNTWNNGNAWSITNDIENFFIVKPKSHGYIFG